MFAPEYANMVEANVFDVVHEILAKNVGPAPGSRSIEVRRTDRAEVAS